MGNSTNSFNQNFLNDWEQIERVKSLQNEKIIWAKKSNKSVQMEEYNLNVSSKEQLEEEQKIHSMRQNHPQLVSSLHFQDETQAEFCASNYKGEGKIFIERIPLTLQSVTDIPFPDALHIYSQTLQGFHTLANQVESGCFPVSEQHIGINCDCVCKVWMNGKFNRNYPSRNQKITEERMVKNILDIVEENCDLGSLEGKPSPVQYIYSRARTPSQVKFGEAINLLRDYSNEFFSGVIPEKVSCVEKVGGAFLLSRNWEGQKAQINAQIPIQGQYQSKNFETPVVSTYPQGYSSAVPQNSQPEKPLVIKGQEQTQKQIIIEQQPPFFSQGSIYQANKQASSPTIVNPPIVQTNTPQIAQTNQIKINQSPSKTILTPPFVAPQRIQAPPVVQQVVYRNQAVNVNPQATSMKRSQFISPPIEVRRSQFVHQTQVIPQSPKFPQNKKIGTSIVFFNTPRQEIRQNLIQNRVEQVTSQKGIVIQPLSYTRPQVIIGQYPVNVQQQPSLQVQTPQIPIVEQQEKVTNIKRSTIIYNAPGQGYQEQTIQTEVKTTEVVTKVEKEMKISGQVMINNSELQKVNSKLVIMDKISSKKETQKSEEKKKEESPQYTDYSTNYYTFTNKLYDREEPSAKDTFSTKLYSKQEQSPKEQFASKLYGKNEALSFETDFKPSKLKTEDYSSANYDFKQGKEETTIGKYKVNLDDGMSSADFLNQLKSIGSTHKASDSKFDFSSSYSSYLNKDYGLRSDKVKLDGDKTSSQLYSKSGQQQQPEQKQASQKINQNDYKPTLTTTNVINDNDDLVVVGSKIEITPISANQIKQSSYFNQYRNGTQNEKHYRMSYQYEEDNIPSTQYQEQEILYINNQNNHGQLEQSLRQQQQQQEAIQKQQQDYYDNEQQQQKFEPLSNQNMNYQFSYEPTAESRNYQVTEESRKYQPAQEPYNYNQTSNNYKSIFDKYASLTNEHTSAEKPLQNYDEQQFISQPQESSEQYKVQFDPEILADLQKLKGVN